MKGLYPFEQLQTQTCIVELILVGFVVVKEFVHCKKKSLWLCNVYPISMSRDAFLTPSAIACHRHHRSRSDSMIRAARVHSAKRS